MGDSGSAWSGVRPRARVRGYTPVRGVAVDRAGVLLEGREDLTGTPVLIRILSPALAADHAFMRGARHAWERLRELRHANLVSIITFDATAAAVVEEFLDGTTLAHLMEVQGPVELNGALAMFDACLAGLDALHAAHLCHSDVRPESVVISVSGVVMLRDTAIPVPPLHAGWRAGTPQYMAPELWAGHAHSPATDVYAATAVLFESITGRPPFPGTELGALRYGHERSPLRVDAVPAVARPLLLAGMAKEAPRAAAGALRAAAARGRAGVHAVVGRRRVWRALAGGAS